MAGRVLGDAIVVISPDATGFRTLADAQIRKALAGFRPVVQLGASTKDVDNAIAGIRAKITALSSKLTDMRIGADTKQAEAVIARLQAKLLALTKQAATITMAADTKKLDAQITAEQAKLAGLKQQMSDLQMDADTKRVVSKIADLEKQATHLQEDLESGKLVADVDIAAAEAKLELIDAELRVLRSNAKAVQLAADTRAIQAAITAVQAHIRELKQQAADIKIGASIDVSKLLAVEAALLSMEHTIEQMSKVAPVADTALGAIAGGARGAGGWVGFLTTQVTLFGGIFNKILPAILTSVSVWHVLADAVIEIGAVLIPATVAFGAFAFAASDAAREIQNRLQAMHTELDATGRAIPGLTTGFEDLHNAVRPQVYQLFGDAIDIMTKKSGLFADVAKQTATVVDQLAARFTYAVTSGKGVSTFFANAVTDARLLGTLIGNLAGIFGNFLQVIPGFATHLLAIAVAFTHVIEVATAAALPVERWILLIHGWVLYTGLAVTATLAFVGAMANLARLFVTFAAGQVLAGVSALKTFALTVAGMAVKIYAYGASLIAVAAEEGIFAAATAAISDIPLIAWITLAAAAIVGLYLLFRKAPSAVQQFTDGLQKTVAAAQLTQIIPTILAAQTQVTQRLSAAQAELAKTQEYVTITNLHTGEQSTVVTQAYAQQAATVKQLQEAQSQLSGQYQLVSGRVGALAKQYGGQTQALGALNAAGITTAQILDTNNQHWAQALIQVEATTAAYQVMGVQSGQLGNDLDVLGRTVTDQYQAIQKLNQAWGTFITEVTGTQTSLDTVLQGFSTLADHSGSLVLHLGRLQATYKSTGAAIDSLTPQGVALNQAFADQVNNVEKLYESWRTAGLANNLFIDGVKASIAPLVKYANGSQEATAQLVALAQQAGYQGPISMQALTKWLGNTRDATQRLKDITDQATQQEALLTGAMQAQGNYIASKLIGDINDAILKYNGVEAAAAAYGDAIAKDGRDSDAAHAARQTLINDLIASGRAAGDTTGQIAAMIAKVLGIPASAALQIVMDGTGTYSITQGTSGHAGGTPTGGRPGAATGGFIATGSGPTADDVPIMASRGEYVVKASSVSRYGVGMMNAINAGRYAAGGLVETGNRDVLSGQYAVTMYDAFKTAMTNSMIAAMQASIKSAAAAASAAFTAAGPAPGGANASGVAALRAAAAQHGWTSAAEWNALNYVEMREAGYSLTATNPSSGAYGMAQFINGPGEYYQYGGNPNTYWGQAVAMCNYIAQRYGDPIAAANHEAAFNWYRGGGLVGMAAGGLIGLAGGGRPRLGKPPPHVLPRPAPAAHVQPVPIPGIGSYFKDAAAMRAALGAAQKGEREKFFGLEHSFDIGLSKAKKGSWLYANRTRLKDELHTLSVRQQAEASAYAALGGSGLTPGNLARLARMARAETRTAEDALLSAPARTPNWAGGHPLWDKALRQYLARIIAISSLAPPGTAGTGPGGLPVQGPVAHIYGGDVVANTIGRALAEAVNPFGAAHGGLIHAGPFDARSLVHANSYDSGGYLAPGWNLAWNGTGHPEPVGGGAVHVDVTLHLDQSFQNATGLSAQQIANIRQTVKTRGGGSVQKTFGTH